MHDLYALRDNLVDELKECGRRDLTESSLKTVDTLAHAAKNVIKVIEGCKSGEDGYRVRSDSGKTEHMGSYVRPDGSYRHDDDSYSRGRGPGAARDSRGRYMDSELKSKFHELIDMAPDERTRNEIRRLMESM